MGIDVGKARVGVALSDPDGILATPLKTLRRDAKKNSDRRLLRTFVADRGVAEIFVGHPKTLRGGASSSTKMAEDYAQALVRELAAEGREVPVWLVDERLTTVDAHRALHESGVSSRDFRAVVDQAAAVGILQQCLDAMKSDREVAGFRVLAGAGASAAETPRPSDDAAHAAPTDQNGDHA